MLQDYLHTIFNRDVLISLSKEDQEKFLFAYEDFLQGLVSMTEIFNKNGLELPSKHSKSNVNEDIQDLKKRVHALERENMNPSVLAFQKETKDELSRTREDINDIKKTMSENSVKTDAFREVVNSNFKSIEVSILVQFNNLYKWFIGGIGMVLFALFVFWLNSHK